jgi:IS30 family transposase
LEKAIYQADLAQASADSHLRTSRQGIDLTEEERQRLNQIVSPLLKQGQSPWHICQTHKAELMISDKTLYSYVSANLFDATNFDLERKVKMKPRQKKSEIKIEAACRKGRTYRDFLNYMDQYPEQEVVQMDTVMGSKGRGEKVLLTIHFPHSQFMLAFLREVNTAKSVVDVFDELKRVLQYNRFEELFPILLTDNGPEFSSPSALERDEDGNVWTNIYYCDPHCPYQKGSIEAGHRLIRKVIPKGHSMNSFSQKEITRMMCHINSYARNSLGGRTPLEVFSDIHGNRMAKLLGIRPISHKEINLTPSLMK